jgi:hypothetical protein
MTSYINYPKDKVNINLQRRNPFSAVFFIIVFFYAATIVVIVVRPPAACRRFSPFMGDRRLAAKPVIVSVILISALGATSDQPFFTLLRLHGDQTDPCQSVFVCVCFIDPGFNLVRCGHNE